jgi:hypothetical protein
MPFELLWIVVVLVAAVITLVTAIVQGDVSAQKPNPGLVVTGTATSKLSGRGRAERS